jgi:hypothetical protein
VDTLQVIEKARYYFSSLAWQRFFCPHPLSSFHGSARRG